MYSVQRELVLYADNACIVCLLRYVKQVKILYIFLRCIATVCTQSPIRQYSI
jgi:hypothetical protein